jgi:hypothetical protein
MSFQSITAARLSDRDFILPCSIFSAARAKDRTSRCHRWACRPMVTTGAGAFLDQVIFGYTGVRIFEEGLKAVYPPMLPNGVTEMLISNIMFRGNLYDVSVKEGTTRIVRKLDQGMSSATAHLRAGEALSCCPASLAGQTAR